MKSQLARNLWPEDEITARVATLGRLATPALTVSPDTPGAAIRTLFVDQRVAAICVVSGSEMVGILTRTDVLRCLDGTAADAMSRYVFALPATAPIERAAALMAYEGVGVLAVFDADDGLIGLVSAADLVRHFATQAGFPS